MKPVDLLRKFLLPCRLLAAMRLQVQHAGHSGEQILKGALFAVSGGVQVGDRITTV